MTNTSKLKDEEQVAVYLQNLKHPLTEVIAALRAIFLTADKDLGERIKWNSPSFFYTGAMAPSDPKKNKRDLVVFNLHKPDYVLLVFPTGAGINDPTGLLEGDFADGRKLLKIARPEEVKQKEKDLRTVINLWLASVQI